MCLSFLLCKQKTAYEMRISDWSSDVGSSDITSDTLGQNAVIKQSDAPLSVEFNRLGNWRWCLSWLIVQWVVRKLVTGGIEQELPSGNLARSRSETRKMNNGTGTQRGRQQPHCSSGREGEAGCDRPRRTQPGQQGPDS